MNAIACDADPKRTNHVRWHSSMVPVRQMKGEGDPSRPAGTCCSFEHDFVSVYPEVPPLLNFCPAELVAETAFDPRFDGHDHPLILGQRAKKCVLDQ